jgi:hypothetical protein
MKDEELKSLLEPLAVEFFASLLGSEPKTKASDKYYPPEAAKNNAKKVLRWREEYGSEVKGMTQVGWVRARQLASGKGVSLDVVKLMARFNRHRENAEVAPEYKETPWKDAGYIAWLGWGGTTGIEWAMRISSQHKDVDEDWITKEGVSTEGVDSAGRRYRVVNGKRVPIGDKKTGKEESNTSSHSKKIEFNHIDKEHPIAQSIAEDENVQKVIGQFYDPLWSKRDSIREEYLKTSSESSRLLMEWAKSKVGSKESKQLKKEYDQVSKKKEELKSKLDSGPEKSSNIEEDRKSLAESMFQGGSKIGFTKGATLDIEEHEKKPIVEARNFAASLTTGVDGSNVTLERSPIGRAYYSLNDGKPEIAIGTIPPDKPGENFLGELLTSQVVHELGHHIELTKPGAKEAAQKFVDYRCADEKFTDIGANSGYQEMAGEKGRKDNFDRHFDDVSSYYVGKVYEDGATEVISMGLQALHDNPREFINNDPEYAGFVIQQLMRGAK